MDDAHNYWLGSLIHSEVPSTWFEGGTAFWCGVVLLGDADENCSAAPPVHLLYLTAAALYDMLVDTATAV